MKNCLLTLAMILSAAVTSAAAPQQPRVAITQAHTAITQAQIAAAINDSGMQITADQVQLLAEVVASTAKPLLIVESMQPWGDHRMRVRISCAASEQCMPFFVALRLVGDGASKVAIATADPSTNPRTAIDPKSFVVHAGAAATLLLDGGHVHIRIAVVCLENGAAGQTIRVASKDHTQTYMAKVIDQAVLRASL